MADQETTVTCPHCGGTFRKAFYNPDVCPADPKNAKKPGERTR
ncbi:hypothetical protein [Sphaerimonospora thailandensis]|uniref:Uncharacterized protein n=1 Tax=Sphaerimonospora thailandensis TaxID=795644 RepID=A0A8J3R5F6_9ACTN|nr:hypothetical protein [Sphaerimonospora thailandensis]GIH69427.1 hypothetical protein Mth01_16800 [Sphaerimonospora thailandensis]